MQAVKRSPPGALAFDVQVLRRLRLQQHGFLRGYVFGFVQFVEVKFLGRFHVFMFLCIFHLVSNGA
jgi:hypothetical protein